MYLLFISLTVIGLGMVGVRYSQISQFNYDIQSTKKENRLMAEKNAAMKLQIEQMSNRDRIQSEAERQGMVFNPEAVHVLGQAKTQGKVQASSIPSPQPKQP